MFGCTWRVPRGAGQLRNDTIITFSLKWSIERCHWSFDQTTRSDVIAVLLVRPPLATPLFGNVRWRLAGFTVANRDSPEVAGPVHINVRVTKCLQNRAAAGSLRLPKSRANIEDTSDCVACFAARRLKLRLSVKFCTKWCSSHVCTTSGSKDI